MRRISIIILSIFLIHTSPVPAGVGDVYCCTSKANVGIENFKMERFTDKKFTLKRTFKGVSFGKGFSSGFKMQRKIFDYGTEQFIWGSDTTILSYEEGSFTFVLAGTDKAIAMQPTCSIF